MLGVRTYTKKYIAASRSKIEADLSAYKAQAAGGKVSAAFETVFFNNMLIVLDHLFVHRLRGVEGKDGNALNEARMLSDSIMNNNEKLAIDKSIAYNASQSILKVKVGEEIKVTEAGFLLLYKAFFVEIENKFFNQMTGRE